MAVMVLWPAISSTSDQQSVCQPLMKQRWGVKVISFRVPFLTASTSWGSTGVPLMPPS